MFYTTLLLVVMAAFLFWQRTLRGGEVGSDNHGVVEDQTRRRPFDYADGRDLPPEDNFPSCIEAWDAEDAALGAALRVARAARNLGHHPAWEFQFWVKDLETEQISLWTVRRSEVYVSVRDPNNRDGKGTIRDEWKATERSCYSWRWSYPLERRNLHHVVHAILDGAGNAVSPWRKSGQRVKLDDCFLVLFWKGARPTVIAVRLPDCEVLFDELNEEFNGPYDLCQRAKTMAIEYWQARAASHGQREMVDVAVEQPHVPTIRAHERSRAKAWYEDVCPF